MKKWQNSFERIPTKGETFKLPSLTVPNMTLGLKEILDRYSMGNSVVRLAGQYYGDDDEMMDQISKMDPIERLELARDLRLKHKQTLEKIELDNKLRQDEAKKLAEAEANKNLQNSNTLNADQQG